MANTNSAKGNPASTRMSNPKYKAKRAANLIKNAPKVKRDGKIGKGNLSNYQSNEHFHDLRKNINFGLGQRAVRRVLDGTNKSHSLTFEQIAQLTLLNGSTEAMRAAIAAEKNAN